MTPTKATISVIIPICNAGEPLAALIRSLRNQTLPPREILIVDSSSQDGAADLARRAGCDVEVIPRSQFGHGRTRNRAAARARGEILVFMSQDAMPADDRFLSALTEPLRDGRAAAAYARQVAPTDASPSEVFLRQANYADSSHVRTAADVKTMGIRALMLSNVASAVRREAFEAAGGFADDVIMNEDMLLCADLLASGLSVAYQAEAVVTHGHSYSLKDSFGRYFDIGVFTKRARTRLSGVGAAGAGLRFAVGQLCYLVHIGAWRWAPRTLIELALKFVAFRLGRAERCLPVAIKRRLSLHSRYWRREGKDSDARSDDQSP